MGLMDKMKQGAEQALSKAHQGLNQGKAKIDEVQAKRQWDALLCDLGAAVYAEQRQGGPSEAVTTALAALDEHLAVHGPVDAEAGTAVTTEGTGEAPTNGAPVANASAPAGSAPADSAPADNADEQA